MKTDAREDKNAFQKKKKKNVLRGWSVHSRLAYCVRFVF